jgi:steroid 5-alpha reductase family enzyme
MTEIYLQGLLAMIVLGFLTWIVSVKKQDASIVDSIWSLMFLFASIIYLLSADTYTSQQILVFTLVTIWALRLSVYITWRNWGKSEDSRYQDIRARYSPNFALKSLFIIFTFQAILAWLISLPLWFVFSYPVTFGLINTMGLVLWFIGIFFEAVGDAQLAKFRKSGLDQKKEVMDRGLWRYTRHPNYFGEACIWWGYYLFALSAGGWWTIIAPVLMTWLLLKFSGVALLEKDIVHRRPAYQDYIQRTSAFFPWPPKKAEKSDETGKSDEISEKVTG